jgi:hypothetical protein
MVKRIATAGTGPRAQSPPTRAAGRAPEQRAAAEFKEGIQPVWDAFSRSIRSTAAELNRAAGAQLVALPTDVADRVQLRTAVGPWTETIDISLDRKARSIVGERRESGPGVRHWRSAVEMPTLTLQVTDAPMRFDNRGMTATEAGMLLVKRMAADAARHQSDLRHRAADPAPAARAAKPAARTASRHGFGGATSPSRSGGRVDAPGKKHRTPPASGRGVPHSDETIAKIKGAQTMHRGHRRG